jgi:hypothetical protein
MCVDEAVRRSGLQKGPRSSAQLGTAMADAAASPQIWLRSRRRGATIAGAPSRPFMAVSEFPTRF